MTTPSEPPHDPAMEELHDPTMEEILASIRKIISEDQPDSIKPKAPDLRSPNGAGDILDLTDEVPDEASGMRHGSASTAPMTSPGAPVPQFDRRDPVLSDSSRQAIGRAFQILDKASQQYSDFAGGMLEPVFSRAVQDAVSPNMQTWINAHEAQLLEAIRPLMREWMDANLPRLVESVLKEELRRAVMEHLRGRLG